MMDNTAQIEPSSIENSSGETMDVFAVFTVQSTCSNKRHSKGIAYYNGESVRCIVVTVLESNKLAATNLFWPTASCHCAEKIILVDLVSKPVQQFFELPFLVQNVVFESGEEFVMIPVGVFPLFGPSQAREDILKRPARV